MGLRGTGYSAIDIGVPHDRSLSLIPTRPKSGSDHGVRLARTCPQRGRGTGRLSLPSLREHKGILEVSQALSQKNILCYPALRPTRDCGFGSGFTDRVTIRQMFTSARISSRVRSSSRVFLDWVRSSNPLPRRRSVVIAARIP